MGTTDKTQAVFLTDTHELEQIRRELQELDGCTG